MKPPIKIIHLITGLSTGGAENTLAKLLAHKRMNGISSKVISLKDDGPIGDEIRKLGIPVINLGWRAGSVNLLQWLSLIKTLKKESPDILQTWMYHADLVGGICGKLAGIKHILWNIRNLNLDKAYIKSSTMWVVKVCAQLSKSLPKKIIVNSEHARTVHIKNGYDPSKFVIIPNGFDLSKFHPDKEAKASVLKELNLPADNELVGLVARYDPIKDHVNFLNAARILHKQNLKVHFLLCGRDITWENKDLVKFIEKNDLLHYTHLLGERKDIPRLTAALEIAVSSSAGESFSNTIGEAMSCGVPCVVTDVGDSANLVSNTGKVVPPNNHKALAEGIMEILTMSLKDRRNLGLSARQRIHDKFELSCTLQKYKNLYLEITSQ